MKNQDIQGDGAGGANAATPSTGSETMEQQLAREREERALMRDRLRNTEALAAESHALRAGMAQELERVTAERDRLRAAVASGTASAPAPVPAGSPAVARAPTAARSASTAPPMTPHADDGPVRPPVPPRRTGPWLALSLLTGLAVGVAGLAWITGTLPGENTLASAPAATQANIASTAVAPAVGGVDVSATSATSATASSGLASATRVSTQPFPDGAVALPALTPESVLAAAPTATGQAPNPAPAALPNRLRTALDAEGIVAPVEVDPANGHVDVSDPAADTASRDRTDMIIRAVYAGASLPEPRIEHRWLSPPRAGRAAVTVAEAPAAVLVDKPPVHATAAHAAAHGRGVEPLADAPEARAVLPEGRVTAGCKEGIAAKSTSQRAVELSACMRHSCCSSANRQTEECRAYDKAYPFTCGAGG